MTMNNESNNNPEMNLESIDNKLNQIQDNVARNPLLDAIKLPGQKFRLPSKGKLYDEGVLSPDVIDGEVEVKPMNAIDDITLKTPDMLFDGSAVLRVIQNCVPQILQPEKLLTKDVDHLLACLRKVSYGDMLDIKWTCENSERLEAEDAKKIEALKQKALKDDTEVQIPEPLKIKPRTYTINLASVLSNKTTELDDKMMEKFKLTLSNNQIITFKPFTFVESVQYTTTVFELETSEINQEIREMSDEDYAKKIIDISILPTVHDVDGCSNKEFIREWLHGLPRTLFKEIQEHYEDMPVFGADFTYKVKCQDCGEVEEITSSINPVGFFMQP